MARRYRDAGSRFTAGALGFFTGAFGRRWEARFDETERAAGALLSHTRSLCKMLDAEYADGLFVD